MRFVLAAALLMLQTAVLAGEVELALDQHSGAPTVTLTARDASLGEVLNELARRAGFRLDLPAELVASRGTWELRDLPLEEALRRIVEPHSMLLTHEADAGAAPRIAEVHVLPRSPAPSAVTAPPAAQPPVAQESPAPPPVDTETAKWAKVLDSSPDAVARRSAVAELERLGGDTAVRALEAALSDRDVTLRTGVVEALGRLATDAALMSLGRAAIGDPAPEVRRAAVEALAANPGERSRLFLREAARDRSPEVRDSAARALGTGVP